jgi:hypothetical protein
LKYGIIGFMFAMVVVFISNCIWSQDVEDEHGKGNPDMEVERIIVLVV